MQYISIGFIPLLRQRIISLYCWRCHFGKSPLAKRDWLSIICQLANAGLECLVNDVYSNNARRWSKRGWLSKKFGFLHPSLHSAATLSKNLTMLSGSVTCQWMPWQGVVVFQHCPNRHWPIWLHLRWLAANHSPVISSLGHLGTNNPRSLLWPGAIHLPSVGIR